MPKLQTAIGDIVAPIVFMLFIGYQIGRYSGKLALSIIVCFILGFIAAMLNIWKLMKKLGRKDD